MRNRIFLLFLLFFPFFAHAVKVPVYHYSQKHPAHPLIEAPWFTGPLLAPSSFTIPVGHINIEPYLYISAITAHYGPHWETIDIPTFWNNISQTLIEFGITKWLDFQLNPTVIYNYTRGAGKWVFGDMPIGVDFQLYNNHARITEWLTALKLAIRETLPLGKYQNLNPLKLSTDIGGRGSWQTAVGIVWGNLFYLGNDRFLAWRTALQYTLPAPVRVKNLNVYGGAKGTRGTVYPAQNVQIDTAIEVSLTKNWVFACDFLGSWFGKTRFEGTATAPMTAPPGAQFSLAPAIEYNWNANIGIIFGPWFTIAGRNTIKFTQGVFAFNWYH